MKKGVKKSTPEMVREMVRLRIDGWSYPKIGKKLGRDHATVMYWIKKAHLEQTIPMPVTGRKYRQAILKEKLPLSSPMPEIITGEDKKIKKMSPWNRFIYQSNRLKKQARCPHKVMIAGRCWMCGYVKSCKG